LPTESRTVPISKLPHGLFRPSFSLLYHGLNVLQFGSSICDIKHD
jgi:hypothetical protein